MGGHAALKGSVVMFWWILLALAAIFIAVLLVRAARFRPDMFDGADRLHRYRRRYFGAVPQADRGGRSRSDRRETLRDLPATERAYGCRGK